MLDDLAAVDVRGSWYQSLYDAGYNFGYSCTDPFGWGFGGGGWWGSGIGGRWGDPFLGGEICTECWARGRRICLERARARTYELAGQRSGFAVSCALAAAAVAEFVGPLGFVGCAVALGYITWANGRQVQAELNACIEEIPSNCAHACQ